MRLNRIAARRIWQRIRRIWITLAVSATAIFVIWSLAAYRASGEALAATTSDSLVTVMHDGGVWRFTPRRGVPARVALIFFPGALVDPRAYAPLLRAVAAEGFRSYLVELPRRGAFGGADDPELAARLQSVLRAQPESAVVVLAGHSRGAVVAVTFAATPPARLAGLALIGTSHPRDIDLHNLSLPVVKVVGTRDGLASPAEVRANAHRLPASTRWTWVEGGNHSQFGWYGFQPGDRWPAIEASEQRVQMIAAVLALLRSIDTDAGA